MENLISRELLSKTRQKNLQKSKSVYNKALEVKKRNKYFNEVSIFLSHKHGETELIEQIIVLFEDLGVSVYIDWLDSEMPKTTNGSTAKRIKEKIRSCDKFIFLATESAISSKWCNWELGHGDSQKFFENIAVMPITEKPKQVYSGNEYLEIYPIITSQSSYSIGGEFYLEFEGKKVKLSDWLKS
ncbi:MAG: toll/interleukin-1 receptor domain-containing protein [Flavobacteriaceae bacterium]|nr:toll/interleukin-1 receptor domain-containing protein [Flavobacteriaceae bacterium]